jgi:RNA polymerase sigma factor (sigma-70 family)
MAFVLLKVIETYRRTRGGTPFGPFRAYLYHALENRLQDLLRREWRTTRYIDGSVTPEGLERLLAAGCARNARHVLSGAGSNPARIAEWRELRLCIVRRVATLDEDSQFVWQEALAGTELHEIAEMRGISYDKVKRVRRRLQREVLAIVG